MIQKERIKEISIALKYFIERNFPVENTLMLMEDEDNISDQKQRIYNDLMSDESLLIDEFEDDSIEVRSNLSLNSCGQNNLKKNLSVDMGNLSNIHELINSNYQTQSTKNYLKFLIRKWRTSQKTFLVTKNSMDESDYSESGVIKSEYI